MANQNTIQATGRKDEGKGASRRLRRAGQVPAVVYGGKSAPVNIQLDHEKTWVASQNEWFYSSILGLDIDGKVENVLLRDLQRHPCKQLIMHIDFQRVDANEQLRTSVPLRFVNGETSPAGKTAGVVIMHELTQVEVSCLPKDLPGNIEVDLADLKPGDTIHLSQLKLPQGVELPQLKLGPDHDVAVVAARMARVEAEETTDEAAEGATDAAAAAPAAGEGEAEGEAKGE
ncbi:50S ribosomal protein L25/general stress protein Ctc [Cognatiluteimonas lumbrici]|uniref:50S ribosomal protein L25/general stress protein Ctc n=1 Tax=Cognatiluteimonas lumbrici TaxID=2559601 RepID=UPI00112BDB67|nr:50S ribosomal protein L25/general stress protein Ctc [Luteimonas lumbrici]